MEDIVLRAENISFSYTASSFINDLCINIKKGRLITILGENGCGKSTLLNLLNGNLSPKSGHIFYNEKKLSSIPLRQRAKEMTTVFQSTDTDFPFTCFETIAMGLYPHKGIFEELKEEDIDFISNVMELTQICEFSQKPLTMLSGGEKQRVLLAKALVQKPKLLFLDEGMSSLDIASRIKYTALLRELCEKKSLSVVCVSHDLSTSFEFSHEIAAMKHGKLIYHDITENLVTEDFFKQVFGVKAELFNKRRFFIHNIY